MSRPFKEFLSEIFGSHNNREIMLELYERTPTSVRALTNLIPVTAALNAYLSYYVAEREQKNMWNALYELQKYYSYILDLLSNLDEDYVERQGPELTNLYFEHCKNTYDREKIKFFRNVWINGMIKDDRDLDEKAYVFDLAASLTLDQIMVLRHIYKSFSNESNDFRVEDIAKELKIDKARVQHLCISLQGQGLLQVMDLKGVPTKGGYEPMGDVFRMTDYVNDFVMYLIEPDFAPSHEDHKQIESTDSD
ncbi:MAG: MarR family transcriptional regulator [Candidatus Altiarchaeota archaeon]|nr:MarR family transcriptional regulator [Candidatus Altiarchaeota archaeon]